MTGAFKNCDNLTESAEDAPDLSKVTDMSEIFAFTAVFNGDLNNWDVSHITDMNWTFSQAYKFNGNISEWDVSWNTKTALVSNMEYMFYNASAFTDHTERGSWNIDKVTSHSHFLTNAGTGNTEPTWK